MDTPTPGNTIPPSETMRQCLQEFLSEGSGQQQEPTSTLVRLAARVVLQGALEAEQPGTAEWTAFNGAIDKMLEVYQRLPDPKAKKEPTMEVI